MWKTCTATPPHRSVRQRRRPRARRLQSQSAVACGHRGGTTSTAGSRGWPAVRSRAEFPTQTKWARRRLPMKTATVSDGYSEREETRGERRGDCERTRRKGGETGRLREKRTYTQSSRGSSSARQHVFRGNKSFFTQAACSFSACQIDAHRLAVAAAEKK